MASKDTKQWWIVWPCSRCVMPVFIQSVSDISQLTSGLRYHFTFCFAFVPHTLSFFPRRTTTHITRDICPCKLWLLFARPSTTTITESLLVSLSYPRWLHINAESNLVTSSRQPTPLFQHFIWLSTQGPLLVQSRRVTQAI